jgi:hypothetical protein
MVSAVARLGVLCRRRPWFRPRSVALGLAVGVVVGSGGDARGQEAAGTVESDTDHNTTNGYTPPAGA